VDIERYNRRAIWEVERVRDFLILHYKANERDGQPFWDYCRNTPTTDHLQEKLEIFQAHGRVFREADELFNDTSWFSVLVGQNVKAERYDPLADIVSADELRARMNSIRSVIQRCAEVMPTHRQFIAQNCAAGPHPLQ
jgi:tryptophan halogenase